MKTEILALIISVASILGTAFTFFFYDRRIKAQEKKLNDFQLKRFDDEEVENKKAELRANTYINGKNSKLKVYNKGKACARNIDIKLENDHQVLISNNPFPIEYMHPQDYNELTVLLTSSIKNKIEIIISWDDDFATNRRHKQIDSSTRFC